MNDIFHKRIQKHIDTSFDLLTYNSVIECTVAWNNEQYYDIYNHDRYFFQHANDGSMIINSFNNDDEYLEFEIDLCKNGEYIIKIYGKIERDGLNDFYEYCEFKTTIYEDEEEYFMQSTVQDLFFTLEENNKIVNFMHKANELIELRGSNGKPTP